MLSRFIRVRQRLMRHAARGTGLLQRMPCLPGRLWTVLGLILLLGVCVRLWHIASPPLDFHPARQFMCATIARYYFLSGRQEVPEWRQQVAYRNMRNENMLEPHLMERLAAGLYRLGGQEAVWLPRVLSVVFWLCGGVILFGIASRLWSWASGIAALVVYLFLPFSILASRSFQPDPLMVFLELLGIWALLRFAERECFSRLLFAAVICAFATFVKPICLPLLLGAYGVSFVLRHGWRDVFSSRFSLLLGVVLLVPVAYYLYKMTGDSSSDLGAQASGSIVPRLLLTSVFWRGVAAMLGRVVGWFPFAAAVFAAVFLCERQPYRGTLWGLGLGYLLVTVTFTFHTHTHDYYHLQLIPLVALALGGLAPAVVSVLHAWGGRVGRRAMVCTVLLLGAGLLVIGAAGVGAMRGGGAPRVKATMQGVGAVVGIPVKFRDFVFPGSLDIGQQVATAQQAGDVVQHSVHTIFLGHDGGTALTYLGEFSGRRWPSAGQLAKDALLGQHAPDPAERLSDMLQQAPESAYFVITDFGDLAQQPGLASHLAATYRQVVGNDHLLVYSLHDSALGEALR